MAGSADSMMVDSTNEFEIQSQPVPISPACNLSGYSWNTRDARYQPYPSIGDRHQSDMAEMCRPNPLPRWQRAKRYAKPKTEPFSSFRNNVDTGDADYSFPTLVCQRLGCWQETPHEHSDDEIAQHIQSSASNASELEDDIQRAQRYMSHFKDDEDLMRRIRPPTPEKTTTRPPIRLRGPVSSRSLIDGSKRCTGELERALPAIAEDTYQAASSMSLPVRPRPPGNVVVLPIRSVQTAKASTEAQQQGKAVDQPNELSPTINVVEDLPLVDSMELSWEEALAAEIEQELDDEAARNGS